MIISHLLRFHVPSIEAIQIILSTMLVHNSRDATLIIVPVQVRTAKTTVPRKATPTMHHTPIIHNHGTSSFSRNHTKHVELRKKHRFLWLKQYGRTKRIDHGCYIGFGRLHWYGDRVE
jgi:hypothetical protein